MLQRWLKTLMMLFLSMGILKAQRVLTIDPSGGQYDLVPYAGVRCDESGTMSLNEVQQGRFFPASDCSINTSCATHWLKFIFVNKDSSALPVYISIPFSDRTSVYLCADGRTETTETGDLQKLPEREVKNGQICFSGLTLPPHDTVCCFFRLQSLSAVSQQFKHATLQSLTLYTPRGYQARFEKSRYYDAFFYGAVIIMLFFNLFIYLSLRARSYLLYIWFLFQLCLFLSSNSGYLFELVLPSYPRVDLIIRFVSAPVLIISYIAFSKDYLEARIHTPSLRKAANGIIALLLSVLLCMAAGYWKAGRMAGIILSLASFVLLLVMAGIVVKKGYAPAKFFLAGNILVILGGMMIAFEKFYMVTQNPLTHYTLLIAILLELAMFSMGLAHRFNEAERKLSEVKLENERREREHETEQKRIIEQKNKELELSNQELDAFIYKTAHDLRGPLARLLGLSGVAMMDVKEDNALAYFSRLHKEANDLNHILRRLSNIYEISKLEPMKDPVNFSLLIDEILSDLDYKNAYKDTRLAVTVEENPEFRSDRRLLKFVLCNLIENAFRFQRPGKEHCAEIKVLKTGPLSTIYIADTGMGIPEEETSTIFDLFSTAAKKYQTPGLGLYMVKTSLSRTGGSIVLEKNTDPTVFRVDLCNPENPSLF